MRNGCFFKLGFLALILLVFNLGPSGIWAEDKSKSIPKDARINIPWEEVKKLLRLDEDEIKLSWEEFEKLLKQTGRKPTMPYAMREEKIVLTRSQFRQLLDQMRPPSITKKITPPITAGYLITSAVYRGRMSEKSTSFVAKFTVEIFERERTEYVKIPLFPQNIALDNVLIDDKPAIVTIQNDMYTLNIKGVGRHIITVNFSIKTDLDKEPSSLQFPIPKTPMTSLELDIPLGDIGVEVANAQTTDLRRWKGTTRISSILLPSTAINVKWYREAPRSVRGPAKIYANIFNLISAGKGILRVNTTVNLSVLQNTISSLSLQIPRGYNVLEVKGEGVGDWWEAKGGGVTTLVIPLVSAREGDFTINIETERLFSKTSVASDFSGLQVIGAVQEKGFVGITSKDMSEVKIIEAKGLDEIDVSELPAELLNLSQRPLLFGFRYLSHPYHLILDVKEHEELPTVSTVIDSANGVTLFTDDGKLIHRIVYKVRNIQRQFLEITLPKDAQIWNVFVANEPVRPRREQDKILIPLGCSRMEADSLTPFEVEIIYYQKVPEFTLIGHKSVGFPVPDVIISRMLWSLYLPLEYTCLYFGGNLEKERIARGIKPAFGPVRSYYGQAVASNIEEFKRQVKGRHKSKFGRKIIIGDKEVEEQMENEMLFSQRLDEIRGGRIESVGTLPIRIHIPTTGHIYRFAKVLIFNEPLTLSLTYANNWIAWILKWSIVLLIFWLVYKNRIKLIGLAQRLRERLLAKINPRTPRLFFVLAVLTWFISKPLSLVLLGISVYSWFYLRMVKDTV